VDDIVFGGSSYSLVARFADDMSRKFEMSMMGIFLEFLEFSEYFLCFKTFYRISWKCLRSEN
jgi:hypothetical protein